MKTKKIEERAKKIKPGNEDEKALSKKKRSGNALEALSESEDRYRDLVENSQDLIYTHDLEGKLLSMNEAAVRITGYPLKDLLSMNLADLLVPEVRHLFKGYLAEIQAKGWSRGTMRILTPSGEPRYLEYYNTLRTKGVTVAVVRGLGHDITERERAEKIQHIQYNIANAMIKVETLSGLLEMVRKELSALIDTANFLVAIYDETSGLLSAPFERDEKDAVPQWRAEKSLTGLVIKQKRSMLLRREQILQMFQAGTIELIGTTAEAWLGVPLQINDKVLGAIVVQSYDKADAYDQNGVSLLEIIANQLSSYIERKQVEEQLRETSDYLNNLLDYANAPIIVWDSAYHISLFNHAFERLTGRSASSVLGKEVDLLFPPAKREESLWNIHRASSGEHWETVEIDIQHMDGTVRTLLWNSASLYVPGGTTVLAIIAQGQDITERKQAEALLQQERELYLDLVNNQPVGIYRLRVFPREQWQKDAWKSLEYSPYSLELVNDRFCEILGINRQVFETNPGFLNDLIYIEDKAEFARKNEEANVKLIPFQWEGRLFIKGKILWVHFESLPRPVANGDVLWMGTLYDITERKQAESQREAALEALRESEERYRTLFENTGTSIIIIEEDATISLVNEEFARRTGYTRSEIEGVKRWTEIVDREDIERMVAQHQLRRESPGDALPNYEFRYRTKSGELRYALINVQLVPGTRKSMASLIDITERKQSEEALQTAFQENRNLLGELQHRAKNSFAMIFGMISLATSAGVSPETKAALDDLGSRVRSVSELYSLLYSAGSFTEVRLDEYCARIAAPLVGLSGNITLNTEIESITVPVKEAAPLGLILTELMTNAGKYAFPGGRRGTITVALKKTVAGARLEVRDDGVGLPAGFDFSGSTGMGLKLVRALSGQINGSFRIEGGAAGTRCIVEFAAAKNGSK